MRLESAEHFYTMFKNIDEACRAYCQDDLFPSLKILDSHSCYNNFNLIKENDKVMVVINYSRWEQHGIMHVSKTIPIYELIVLAMNIIGNR